MVENIPRITSVRELFAVAAAVETVLIVTSSVTFEKHSNNSLVVRGSRHMEAMDDEALIV